MQKKVWKKITNLKTSYNCSIRIIEHPKYRMCGNINSIIHLALPGESDVTLEFSESDMVRDIFGKMDTLNCLYTAQITPRTDQDSLEIFVFERESESHLRIFSAIKVFNKRYVVTGHRSQV